MCGIVGVVRRRSTRAVFPTPPAWSRRSTAPSTALAGSATAAATLADTLISAAVLVEGVDRELRGVPGVRALLADPQAALVIADRVEQLTGRLDALEAELDDGLGASLAAGVLEQVNAALVRTRDAVWAVAPRPPPHRREVALLAGADPSVAAIEAFHSVQVALSAIDRLEVRGRDSAGLHLLVRHHGLDLDEPAVAAPRRGAHDRSAVRLGFGARDGGRTGVRLQGRGRDR